MAYNLTRKQKQILDFIRTFISMNGFCPSYSEIASGVGVKSKGAIAAHIKNLELRGWIKSGEKMKRSITIIVD